VSVNPPDIVRMQVHIPSRSQRVQNLQSPVWKLQHEKTATGSEFGTILWQSLESVADQSLKGDIKESELSEVLSGHRGEIAEAASSAALSLIQKLLDTRTSALGAEETIVTEPSRIAPLEESQAPDSSGSSGWSGRLGKRLRRK
jgi:hypothetical protein